MDKIRIEDFGCPFGDEQRKLAEGLVAAGDVSLLESREEGLWEAKVRFFRRRLDTWIQQRPDGGLEHDCSCPYLENTGEGCAHRFALMLVVNGRAREESRPAAAPIVPRYLLHAQDGGIAVSLAWQPEPHGDLVPLVADAEHVARIEDRDDAAALQLLLDAAGGRRSLLEGGGFVDPAGPWPLAGAEVLSALRTLAATGRLSLAGGSRRERRQALQVDEDGAFELVMRVQADGARCRLGGLLRRGAGMIPVETLDLAAGKASVAIHDGRILAVDAHGGAAWLSLLGEIKPVPVPPRGVPSFLARLQAADPLPRLWLPEDPAPLPLAEGTPRGRLTVAREGTEAVATLSFTYAEREVSFLGSRTLLFDTATRRQLQRSSAGEDALAARLEGAPFLAPHSERAGCYLVELAGVEELAAELLDEGWEILVDGRGLRPSATPKLRISSDVDWFGVEGAIRYGDEEATLGDVYDAWSRGQRFVTLPSGDRGLVPSAWLERLRGALELARRRGEELRFSRAQAPLVQALCEQAPSRGARDALRNVAESLAALRDPQPTAPTTSFQGSLRPYQQVGLGWLRALASAGLGGCLADDMGLGKTVQALAHLAWLRDAGAGLASDTGPFLVVAPRSLLWNWEQEARSFVPHLQVRIHAGPRRTRCAADLGAGELVLTTYGTLRRDIEFLGEVEFSVVILDEAQAIKNPDSQSAQAVGQLQARQRLSLTGTPIENSLGELWSQMEFLNPGLAGPRDRFLATLGAADGGSSRALLHQVLRPLILRRRKEVVAPELPERIEQTLFVEMGPRQRAVYDALRARARESLQTRIADAGLGASHFQVLEALLRLRQAASHAALVDPSHEEVPSAKLDLLAEEIEQVVQSGHKALVFSQFTTLLRRVRRQVEERGIEYAWLDGATRDRATPVQRFQSDPACSLFLISLKAGGMGLNLTAADYVFILDPWWNPAVEAQAVDRAHRIGRTERVIAIRLVARDTVEEHMLALKERKERLVEGFFAEDAAGLGTLAEEDLALLLG